MPPIPPLIALYIRQVLYGFALSGVFVALLLIFDVAGLRHLVQNAQGGWLAVFMLFFFNGLVFAGVQFAIAVMRMGDDDDDDHRGGHRRRVGTLIPIRIPQRSPERRR